MTTLSKTLLTVTVVGVIAGIIIDASGFNVNPSLTVVLPFGAVAFGLFLISFMLEKEVMLFDADEIQKAQLLTSPKTVGE